MCVLLRGVHLRGLPGKEPDDRYFLQVQQWGRGVPAVSGGIAVVGRVCRGAVQGCLPATTLRTGPTTLKPRVAGTTHDATLQQDILTPSPFKQNTSHTESSPGTKAKAAGVLPILYSMIEAGKLEALSDALQRRITNLEYAQRQEKVEELLLILRTDLDDYEKNAHNSEALGKLFGSLQNYMEKTLP